MRIIDDVCLTISAKINGNINIDSLYKYELLTDDWCSSNKLSLNMNKTQELDIHHYYNHNQTCEII